MLKERPVQRSFLSDPNLTVEAADVLRANVSLEFHNGPLPYSAQKRIVKPDPTFNGSDAMADQTDYVKECSTTWQHPSST
jgi:hypothetical protein